MSAGEKGDSERCSRREHSNNHSSFIRLPLDGDYLACYASLGSLSAVLLLFTSPFNFASPLFFPLLICIEYCLRFNFSTLERSGTQYKPPPRLSYVLVLLFSTNVLNN